MNDLELDEIMAELQKLYPDNGYTAAEISLYRNEFRKHQRDPAINLIRESRLTTKFAKPDLPSIFQALRGHSATVKHQMRESVRRKSPAAIESFRNSYRKLYGPKCDNYGDVEFVLHHGRALSKAYPSAQQPDIERDIVALLRDHPGFDDALCLQAAQVCFAVDEAQFKSEAREWQGFANAQLQPAGI